jgi:hypothetical protein
MCRSVFIRDGFQFNFQISPDAGETPRPALPLAGGGGQPRQRQNDFKFFGGGVHAVPRR